MQDQDKSKAQLIEELQTLRGLQRQERKERKQMEEEFELFLRGARCVIWHSQVEETLDGHTWNLVRSTADSPYSIVDLSPRANESLSDCWHRHIAPEDNQRMDQNFISALRDGSPYYNHEFRFTEDDGDVHWLHEEVHIEKRGSKSWDFVGIITDITERKQAENALRKSEERYRTLVETPPNLMVMLIAPDGAYRYISPQIETVTGHSPSEFYAHGDLGKEITHPDDFEKSNRAFWQAIEGTPMQTLELRWKHIDGTYRWASETISPIFDPSGRVEVVQAIFQEITEQKRLEEEVRKIQNLESLGILAGGIAHDFNNMLTGVIGNLSLLEAALDKDSDVYQIAVEGQQAADRTLHLTQQLLTFAKGGAPVKKTASIATLIRETTKLSLHGSNTKAVYQLAGDLRSVPMDQGQIAQVMQNLVLNADQAMPEGGALTISAENVELTTQSPLPLVAGNYVKISVVDQGIGMSTEVMAKIFDPYYSTKTAGHGLGLSITHSIVQRHAGHIAVNSAIDVGTTFEFYLPAARQQATETAKSKKPLAHGTGRILLMDDEEIIHKTVAKILARLGYEVESVYDGAAALQRYQTALIEKKRYDLVIVDLTIPGGMGGQETVEKLLVIDPQARVIVSSGYAHDPVMAHYAQYGFVGKIAKPATMQELADAVKRVLQT